MQIHSDKVKYNSDVSENHNLLQEEFTGIKAIPLRSFQKNGQSFWEFLRGIYLYYFFSASFVVASDRKTPQYGYAIISTCRWALV